MQVAGYIMPEDYAFRRSLRLEGVAQHWGGNNHTTDSQ